MNIKNEFHESAFQFNFRHGKLGQLDPGVTGRREKSLLVRKFQRGLQRGDNLLLLEKWERF